ncbi:retinol dehydrogenase 7-like [Haemaphysalis longicornis]
MRTSRVLFGVFTLLFWRLGSFLGPVRQIAAFVGSAWIALSFSYWLCRLSWKRAFVSKVRGDGKAVLITGCDSGFGHRLAKRIARQGFFVFAGCLDSNSGGAVELKSLSNIKILQLDVTKQKQVDEALESVKEDLGQRVLWSVVANAGVGATGLLEWMTMETVVGLFNVNVFGVLRVIKKFLPLLKKSGGRVVTVASPLGRFTLPMIGPYCMSKHAVVSMMDAFRREAHNKSVDFVTVEPSAYRTPIFKPGSTLIDLTMEEFKKQAPEVTADYSHEDIEEWMKTLEKGFEAILRDDPEEAVDVLERAVRETYPQALYRSPLGLDAPSMFLMQYVPSEVGDLLVRLMQKVQSHMK